MKEKTRKIISITLLCIFAAMFIIGMTTPEVDIVHKKATNICLECIGIGG